MNKRKKILALLLCGLFSSLLYAGVTNLDSLTLGSDLVVGDDVTVTDDLTVSGDLAITGDSTLTGNLAVTGTSTSSGIITITTGAVTGLFGLRNSATPNTSVTPTAVGQMMMDTSTNDVCVSTIAAAGGWVLISTPTVACAS